jgi:hypothetical protein
VGTNTEPAVHAEHRDLVRTLDWRRPLGELFLIVAGVLLALAVNNWNTGWQNRATELALLQQLRSALVNDLSNLNDAQNGFRSRKNRIEVLRDDVKRGRAYEDSMASDFGIVLGIWPIHFNRMRFACGSSESTTKRTRSTKARRKTIGTSCSKLFGLTT